MRDVLKNSPDRIIEVPIFPRIPSLSTSSDGCIKANNAALNFLNSLNIFSNGLSKPRTLYSLGSLSTLCASSIMTRYLNEHGGMRHLEIAFVSYGE